MRRRTVLFAALLMGVPACGPSSLEPIDLDGSFVVNPATATVGQPVTAVLEAQGTQLLSLRIQWGDESDDQDGDFLSIAGTREARWTREHEYTEPGTYTITGSIHETNDTLQFTQTVTVNPVAGAASRVPSIFH